jgi:TonB family protein
MSLRPMPRLDPSIHGPEPIIRSDLNRDLEQHVAAGFPADLALDLVLNELVVRAASVTHASGAAAAVLRDDKLVCRAATGKHAPDLGIPLSTRDGLSGACIRTHSPQLSNDTDSDSRVDPATSRALGIRSILVVPVLDESSVFDGQCALVGVLEVFSPVPHAFSESTQVLLAEFARECASLCRTAAEFRDRSSEDESAPPEGELLKSFDEADTDFPDVTSPVRQPYELWTILLASLVILAAVALSFLVGSRVGWLRARATPPPTPVSIAPVPVASPPAAIPDEPPPRKKKVTPPPTDASNAPMSPSDQLVVYEKGKVVYRMKASPIKPEADSSQADASSRRAPVGAPNRVVSTVIPASSKERLADRVWLAPDQAENRLLNRVEPHYPQEALAAHRSGSVVLEVNVAEDGTVSSVRALIGDPMLATAAAQAVRSWRYQPLRSHEQPSPFQTDVTLTFSLPN